MLCRRGLRFVLLVLACSTVAVGCGQKEQPTQAAPDKPKPVAAVEPAPPPSRAVVDTQKGGSAEAAPGDAGDVGAATSIAECDEYLAKVEACLRKGVRPEHGEAIKAAFVAQRSSWQQSAQAARGNPEVASQLAKNCKEALAAARTPMQRYGCDW